MHLRLIALLGLLWLAVTALVPNTYAAGSTGTIAGVIRDEDGRPVSIASVHVMGSRLGAQSGKTGEFLIREVPVGTCRLAVRKMGFHEIEDTVVVRTNSITRLDYVMQPGESRPHPREQPPSLPYPFLVETHPRGTSLGTDLPDATDIWRYLFASARVSIDLAEFYVSDDPAGRSDLTRIMEILKVRAYEGVRIRLLVESKFYKTYPTWVNQLDSLDYVDCRWIDYAAVAGGVQHAKYFVVDNEHAYLGSQNFDWRALEHIQELGVALDDAAAVGALRAIFERDWARGVPVDSVERGTHDPKATRIPTLELPRATGLESQHLEADSLAWQLLASPKDDLPTGVAWDLPRLIEMIDAAHDSIAVQLLTYRPKSRTGEMWDELDGALRRAAGRGVAVRLLLANWGKRSGTVEHLQELSAVPGFELRFMNIPEWSGGFIPFARTAHAKYMVVDGREFWIGTSNWERDYFYNSRNVGIVGRGRALGAELSQFFRNGWDSEYAEPIRAGVTYTPPRIAE